MLDVRNYLLRLSVIHQLRSVTTSAINSVPPKNYILPDIVSFMFCHMLEAQTHNGYRSSLFPDSSQRGFLKTLSCRFIVSQGEV